MNAETKTCQNCKKNFIIEPEDFEFYAKMNVPPPTWCPECRFQRRVAFRNERKLFKTKSAKSGSDIFALYTPDADLTVYDEKEWWSDDWDPLAYGREYDFSRPFFEQFRELMRQVPRFSRSVISMVNSDYCANAGGLKNCYLLFNSNNDEDSAYGNGVDDCKDCFDNSHINKCGRCYGSFWLTNSYQTHFSSHCEDCTNVLLSKNCRGCSDCFGCVNLRGQKYHIFNIPYSREEYQQKIAAMNLHTRSGLQKATLDAYAFWQKFPNKFMHGIKNLAVSGEYIDNSKNVSKSYLVRGGEDLKYVQYYQVEPNKDCYDCSIWGDNNQLGYENMVTGMGTSNVRFCAECWTNVRDLEYCMYSSSSSNLFGCFGLRNKQFCILNRQYTKEEYEALVPKIVEHMNRMPFIDKKGRVYTYGEFFPIEFSPHPYNISIAQEHFPLAKEEALDQGFRWYEPEAREYEATLKPDQLPDSIDDVNESILKETLRCVKCRKAYRIISSEFAFLKAARIPLPRLCVDCRHVERIAQRNLATLYPRQCMCDYIVYKNTMVHDHHPSGRCINKFETAYPPDKPEIVYCEQCYQVEVA